MSSASVAWRRYEDAHRLCVALLETDGPNDRRKLIKVKVEAEPMDTASQEIADLMRHDIVGYRDKALADARDKARLAGDALIDAIRADLCSAPLVRFAT